MRKQWWTISANAASRPYSSCDVDIRQCPTSRARMPRSRDISSSGNSMKKTGTDGKKKAVKKKKNNGLGRL